MLSDVSFLSVVERETVDAFVDASGMGLDFGAPLVAEAFALEGGIKLGTRGGKGY